MDKSDLNKLLNNKVLNNQIFQQVHIINKDVEGYKTSEIFDWSQMVDRPDIASIYGYFDLVKRFYKVTPETPIVDRNFNYEKSFLFKAIINTIKHQHIDIMKYLLEEIYIYSEITRDSFEDEPEFTLFEAGDRFFMKEAAIVGDIEIIEYLRSLANQHPQVFHWDYKFSFLYTPFSGKLDVCKWFAPYSGSYSSLLKRDTFLGNAAKVGSIELIKWALENVQDIPIESNFWVEAVKFGNIDILNYMYGVEKVQVKFAEKELISDALIRENKTVVEWLFSKPMTIPMADVIFKQAVLCGCIDTIKLLHAYLPNIANSELTLSSSNDPLEWLYRNCMENNIFNILELALKGGNLELIQWLYKNEKIANDPVKEKVLDLAIIHERINVMLWLHENTASVISQHAIEEIFFKKNLEIIEWIHNNRKEIIQPTTRLIRSFTMFTEELKWFLLKNKPELLPQATQSMDEYDDLYKYDMFNHKQFQYIIDNLPNHLDDSAIVAAASQGYNDIVEILHQKLIAKYPSLKSDSDKLFLIYQHALYRAAINGRFELVKFIIENGPKPETITTQMLTYDPMGGVASRGYIEIFKYINDNSSYKYVPFHADIARRYGHPNIVQFLKENGIEYINQ